MDPISAAGIGLSVTSLAFQVFAGCIKGYQIYLDVAGMPTKFEHLRVRMQLEQVRLLNWGEKVGLLEDTVNRRNTTLHLHQNVIVDMLFAIQRLFKDCMTIEESFGGAIVQSSNNETIILGPLDQRSTKALLTKALRVFEKTSEVPKRLQWAMLKKEKFQALIEQLISCNDSIVSLLDRTTIDQLLEVQQQSQLTMLQMSSKIDELTQLSRALHLKAQIPQDQILQSGQILRDSAFAVGQPDVNASFASLVSFKADQTSIELESSSVNVEHLSRNLIEITSYDNTRAQAVFENEQVWVEWKEFEVHNQDLTGNETVRDRVKKLAALLGLENKPQEFRVPHCLGFFDDRDDNMARYGLVYRKPKATSELVSLLDLIKNEKKPSLTQRIALAYTVAKSLMYLHSVNWLHKGFRSDNIIFFTLPGQMLDYSTPTLSGFEYARPDLPEELTEKPSANFENDIYRHPDALHHRDERSKKSWDIYSLGIVLLEIAWWKTIGNISDTHQDQKHAWSRLKNLRSRLLEDEFLDKLGGEFGDRYMDVVKICLTGGRRLGISEQADESEPRVGADIQQVFFTGIVGKLESIQL